MKKGSISIATLLMLVASVAFAQAPTPTPPPAVPPSSTASAMGLKANRYGVISGSWLMPNGDFDQIANDGWAITLEGFQFITPTKKIAVGSQVAYQDFGKKNGVDVSNFPVDAVLKFYPKPGTGKADLYLTGGIGFNYTRTDVGYATSTDYLFGTQAGVGVQLAGNGQVGFLVDAVYHWIFASGTDPNFLALRGGLTLAMH